MALQPIPIEEQTAENCHWKQRENDNAKKQRYFNPGGKIKKNGKTKDGSLKNICLRLVHFINRGSRFTHQQIDDLIMAMQRSILSLQRKKQEMMKRKRK